MLEIGSLIDGKYRILRICGQGGMSTVYMAINERANKTWAIKEIRKDGIQDYEVVKQGLIVETDMLKRLNHPNLPSIIDVIDGEDFFLIVMDFIEGNTLSDILKEYGAQPQEKVVHWAKQLADVLNYLHSREPVIIYRDMKPSNIMLKPDGNVVLFDFGTAREYKNENQMDTVCLGTKGYAAPEQYGGYGQSDVRTDIYCLGATLYHLLTGHNPGEPPFEMYPVRHWNPEISGGLEAVILKCTRKNPEERYQTDTELWYDLEHYWEKDENYRKEQLKVLRKFLIPFFLGLVFFAAAVTFGCLKNDTVTKCYERYLMAAHNSETKEEEILNYRKAINLAPYRGEAYEELLQEGLLDDNLLDKEENEILRAVLIEYGNGRDTNQSVFMKNKEDYETFAYHIGIAYFYKFEESHHKKNAKAYLEIAAKSETLEEKQRQRAICLYTIASYYSKIGIPDQTGDAAVTYKDYWNDLCALAEGNIVETDNERTALIIYQEIVSQLISKAVDFKYDGVSQKEMMAQIGNIRKHLEEDFSGLSNDSYGVIKEDVHALNECLEQAERIVASAFCIK